MDKECMICFSLYDDTERRPMVLRCGHSFCKACLLKCSNEGIQTCPNCEKQWGLTDLAECYQLKPEDPLLCQQHNDAAVMWCRQCQKPACKVCIETSNGKCKFIALERAMHDIRALLKREINGKCVEVTDFLCKLTILKETQQSKLKILEQFEKMFSALMQDIILKNSMALKEEKALSERIIFLQKIEKDRNLSSTASTIKYLADKWDEVKEIPGSCVKLEASESLLDVIQTYQKLRQQETQLRIFANFGSSLQDLVGSSSSVWHIANPHTAAAALYCLLEPGGALPSLVIITVTSDWNCPQLKQLLDLLSVVDCDVQLKFMDSFLTPDTTSAARDKERLRGLLPINRKCHLREFFGHLDYEGLSLLPQREVQRLGLAVADHVDRSLVMSALSWFKGVTHVSVTRSYECVSTTLDLKKFLPNDKKTSNNRRSSSSSSRHHFDLVLGDGMADLGEVAADPSRGGVVGARGVAAPFHLHLPGLSAKDVFWMSEVITEMTQNSTSYSLHLPTSHLSVEEARLVLQEVLAGEERLCLLYLQLPQFLGQDDLQKTRARLLSPYRGDPPAPSPPQGRRALRAAAGSSVLVWKAQLLTAAARWMP